VVNHTPVPLSIEGAAPELEPVRRQAPQRRPVQLAAPQEEEQYEDEEEPAARPSPTQQADPLPAPRTISKFDSDVVLGMLGAVLAVALTFGLAAGMVSNSRKATAIAVAEVRIEQLQSALKTSALELSTARARLAAEISKPWWKRLNRWW
jgi:hypothetical protein